MPEESNSKRKTYIPNNTDTDWYCLINGQPVHIASMGESISWKFRERQVLRALQLYVKNLDAQGGFELCMDNIDILTVGKYDYIEEFGIAVNLEKIYSVVPSFQTLDKEIPLYVRLYASNNIAHAKKGFYSYVSYMNKQWLVAKPTQCDRQLISKQYKELCDIVCKDIDENGMPIRFRLKEK